MNATIADELLLESLPQEVRDAIRRVYGTNARYNEDLRIQLREAFEAGWQAFEQQLEVPYYSDYEFTSWMKDRNT